MIERLLNPARIAVIGSLSKPTGLGARTVRHLQDAGYPGEIIRARSAADIDDQADVAVVAVPAAATAGVVAELRDRAAHVIVYSSGFDEAGLTSPLHHAGGRLLGPNTVGLTYAPSRTMLTFAKAFDDMTDCRHGSGVFLVSQSGAFGARLVRAARLHGIDFDGFIGTGNEHDLTACEIAVDLVRSDSLRPRTLALYLEGVRDIRAFEDLLSEARRHEVRVVALLGGASESGAGAARSHTAAVSTDHAMLTELCALHGAVVVRSDKELVDATVALSLLPGARGSRVGVITGSGGAGVVAADLLARHGRGLAPLSARTRERIGALLPSYASTANPVDVTAQVIGDTDQVVKVRAALAESGEVDAILVVGRAEQAEAVAGDRGVPVLLAVLDGDATTVADHVRAGRPVLPSLDAACSAVRALTVVAARHTGQRTSAEAAPRHSATDAVPRVGTDSVSSLRFLQESGVRVAPWQEVTDAADAHRAGEELGWPVVVKANLPTLAHKAARGAVRLDVDARRVHDVATELLAAAPSLIVARQLRAGPELFVGVRRDPQLGLIAAAGLGGGHVELMARTVTFPAHAPAEWMTDRLRAEVFERGGATYAHLPALLAATAARLIDLAVRHDLDLVECNPLVETDGQLIALDARVVSP
ncbi:acetate--CoA ligase family protein [Streptomyces sp. CWNU-52B]|uniref:acetate--CoA ligase family protein n=1 Tax=unclassified Streptomyces TaxID=2593676 RepID=UPI0039BFF7F0